jgi:hypothetical protein
MGVKTSPKMSSRVPLTEALGLIAFASSILAILGTLVLFIRLTFKRLPGRAQNLMVTVGLCNLSWHCVGLYRTFVDYDQTQLLILHFWIGCGVILFDFVTQLEILRVFECITNLSSHLIVKWEMGSIAYFCILSIGTILENFGVLSPVVQAWSKNWLLFWLSYMAVVQVWMQIYITVKLYQSMKAQKRISRLNKVTDFTKDYLQLMTELFVLFGFQALAGMLWLYGWYGGASFNIGMSALKIGESSYTCHFLFTFYFLNRIKQFRFGTQKATTAPKAVPVMVQSIDRTSIVRDTIKLKDDSGTVLAKVDDEIEVDT